MTDHRELADFGKSPLQWYVKNVTRTLYKEVRLALTSKPDYLYQPVVILFAPRSGSTWLVEMLRSIDTVVSVQGPLIERNAFVYAKAYGFNLRPIYFDNSDLVSIRSYLEDIFMLKRAAGLDLDSAGLRSTDASMLVIESPNTPWAGRFFGEEFNAKIINLIRHPIAIVRSQIRFFRSQIRLSYSLSDRAVVSALPEAARKFAMDALENGDEFRMRMAQVFIGYLPIIQRWSDVGVIVTYEELVKRNFDAFAFLSDRDPDWREKMYAGYERPSKSSSDPARIRRGQVNISQRFSADEEAIFHTAVEAFKADALLEPLGINKRNFL